MSPTPERQRNTAASSCRGSNLPLDFGVCADVPVLSVSLRRMGPLPYPHRATFLASSLTTAGDQESSAPYVARLISVIVFDHLVRHPVVTLGDHDDERLVDDAGRLL